MPPAAARRFGEMVRRRLRREPVAYILGRKGFRQIELAVDRRVLIPRPETELLVELALELRPRRVLDVGTGSGAIALAVADELPDCEVVATDTSAAALEVARANAERLGLAERVELRRGDAPATWPGRSRRGSDASLRPDRRQPALRRRARLGGAGARGDASGSRARRCSPAPTASTRSARRDPSRAARPANVRACAWRWRWGRARRARSASCCARPASRAVETRADLAGIERVVWGRR